MDVLVTCKYEEDPIKNEGARVLTIFFPIITLWELSVAMDNRVPIRSGPKPNAAFPPPHDGSDRISLRLARWLRRYSSLKMFTETHTDKQTPARLVYYKLTLAYNIDFHTLEIFCCVFNFSIIKL